LADIRINVYNGTTDEGLATWVGGQLGNRGLTVLAIATSPDGKPYGEVALIRYGPSTVGEAWVLRSFFLDAATEYDATRDIDTVDVVLGSKFHEIATPTEVNRNIAALGRPEAPAGACSVG
jgi:hypothetical protein